MRGVHRRVERRQLVAERQLVAVRVDHGAHVVADDWDRELHERPADRVARRERGRVAVHRDGLVVAGDQVGALVRLAPDRALGPQFVEIRVRVDGQLPVAEEVDVVEVTHAHPFAALMPVPSLR